MIDELGSNILNSIADKLVEKWGGGKKNILAYLDHLILKKLFRPAFVSILAFLPIVLKH
jgi:hypothetical protein